MMANETENIFPLDITERGAGSRPWKFRPQGYLVVILADDDAGQAAEEALIADGVATRDIKRYSGEQILATYEVYKGQRDLLDRAGGALTDDFEGRDLYLDYAKEGRCAMWVRVAEHSVPKTLRLFADHDYLHTRYYGADSETDYQVH